jgi:hypothetical protein
VQPPDDTDGKFAPNAFIRIDPAGKTTLVMPQVEMGQGIYTAVAMILAEELDADFQKVTLEHAPPNDKLYANPLSAFRHRQFQFGPRVLDAAARKAGATARAMLVQAARNNGRSIRKLHHGERRGDPCRERTQLGYGALADRGAAAETPPKDVPLKDPKDFVLIGKPLKRLDTPDKVNGKAVYGIDAMLPGMKFATLAMPGVRRQGRQGRRQRRQENSGRAAGRRAGRSGRGGRRSHVGGEEGPRSPRHHLGRRPQRPSFGRHLGRSARRQRKGRRGREVRRRHRQGPRDRRKFEAPTSCRSSRMRRWSR